MDGYVTDSAVTIDLENGPDSALVACSQMALENAISVMGPGASITEIGNQIESTIKAFGFNPVYNLTGHGVARYVIHCKPSIPNYPDPKAGRLKPNQTIACESFLCDGGGSINQVGQAEVIREGADVTLIGYSGSVYQGHGAADIQAEAGRQADVINMRTLRPLDVDTIVA